MSEAAVPDMNPKTRLGIKKVPLHLVPPSAKHHLAEAFSDGAKKYGPYNWREEKVSASVYFAAAQRHMDAWWDGEEVSSDAKVKHLAHALACLAIVLDAESIGMLNDDRPTKGAASYLQNNYTKVDKEKESEPKQLELFNAANPVVNSRVSDVQADLRTTTTERTDGGVAGNCCPCYQCK